MPDGSALLPDTLHTEVLVQQVNGDQGSPVGIPESPEDKGIIRCMHPPPSPLLVSFSAIYADVVNKNRHMWV